MPYTDDGTPYAKGSETSKDAADFMSGDKKAKQREEVYQALLSCRDRGATDGELEAITGIQHQALSARRLELEQEGRVHETKEQRKNPATGHPAFVHKVGRGEGPLKQKSSAPKAKTILKALNDFNKAIHMAKKQGFQPTPEAVEVWIWLRNRLPDKQRALLWKPPKS